ncbi:MAG: Crossover junction endodeoxyribonuclease RuvC [Microgenomates group bacterium GW2011_GWA2_44_7]|nr:MAG: Crossover junction endodeoxyribonuclease RuvC [Microgenomates group bacterium GW2011_GWA2_44_7]KKT78566.1 MAG: Crossover junction endodeoxyribonuclease RuvC [Microgenomates group bacterium GW2011_GWB1_44_8]
MLVLGIDPGIDRLGWGFVSEENGVLRYIDAGCFTTSKKDREEKRLLEIKEFVSKTIHNQRPDALSIEKIFFAANAKTAISVGQARGVILLTAEMANIPTFAYTPLQVKQAVSGYGQADKHQIQLMVKSILKLPSIPKSDDTADALAIAITHLFSYKLKKLTIN